MTDRVLSLALIAASALAAPALAQDAPAAPEDATPASEAPPPESPATLSGAPPESIGSPPSESPASPPPESTTSPPSETSPASRNPPPRLPDLTPPELAFAQAIQELEAGQLREGCEALRDVHQDFPQTLQGLQAFQLATAFARVSPASCRWVGLRGGEAVQSGATELVLSQGVIAPIWFATSPAVWGPGAQSPVGPVLLTFAGLGLGIGGTYAATREWEPTEGQAMSIYTGELLGGWYGLWLSAGGSPRSDPLLFARSAHAGVLLGGLGGLAFGAINQPRAGDVALIRSGAVWGTGYGAVALAAIAPRAEQAPFLYLGVGTTGGLLVGAVLGSVVELRRGQVNTINLGGYAGTVVGGGFAVLLAQATDIQPGVGAAVVGGGATLGLVISSQLISDTPRPGLDTGTLRTSAPMPTFLATGDGGRVPGFVLSGTF